LLFPARSVTRLVHATAPAHVRLASSASARTRTRRKGRLLLVTDSAVTSPNSGNAMRTWNFVRALQDDYDVNLIHACRILPDEKTLASLEPYFSEIWSVADDGRRRAGTWQQAVADKARMIPWEIAQSYRAGFADVVGRVLAAGAFDVVLARYIYQAQYVFGAAARSGARLVVDIDDIEPKKTERLHRLVPRGRVEQLRLDLNNWVFAQYHKRRLPAADLCLVCSDEDREHVLASGWSSRVAVVPNAIDVAAYAASPAPARGKTLLFCGVLGYAPNVDGICWFVRDVLPRIKTMEPEIRVVIVGRNAAPEVRALASDPAVSLHENVPDVRPYYDEAAAVIVPIRSGGGTRLKVLEAGACRRPVVSTTIGVEGLRMVADRHCLIADEPERFARQCVDVLIDEAKARRLVAAHYEHLKCTYDSPRVREGIRQLFQQIGV
jgi:glycosyltransferase involved in cell wall biosynthesis